MYLCRVYLCDRPCMYAMGQTKKHRVGNGVIYRMYAVKNTSKVGRGGWDGGGSEKRAHTPTHGLLAEIHTCMRACVQTTHPQLEKEADPGFKSTDARQVLQLLQRAREKKAAEEKADRAKWSKVCGGCVERWCRAAGGRMDQSINPSTQPMLSRSIHPSIHPSIRCCNERASCGATTRHRHLPSSRQRRKRRRAGLSSRRRSSSRHDQPPAASLSRRAQGGQGQQQQQRPAAARRTALLPPVAASGAVWGWAPTTTGPRRAGYVCVCVCVCVCLSVCVPVRASHPHSTPHTHPPTLTHPPTGPRPPPHGALVGRAPRPALPQPGGHGPAGRLRLPPPDGRRPPPGGWGGRGAAVRSIDR